MKTSTRITIIAGLVVALFLAGIVSYYASNRPDGLNKVAGDKGLDQQEKSHDLDDSPFAGYSTHGVTDDRLSGGLAGVAGVAITFAIGGAIAFTVRRRSHRDDPGSDVSDGSGDLSEGSDATGDVSGSREQVADNAPAGTGGGAVT